MPHLNPVGAQSTNWMVRLVLMVACGKGGRNQGAEGATKGGEHAGTAQRVVKREGETRAVCKKYDSPPPR